MNRRTVAWSILIVALVCRSLDLWLVARQDAVTLNSLASFIYHMGFVAVGCLVLVRQPRNRLGWLMTAIGSLWVFTSLLGALAGSVGSGANEGANLAPWFSAGYVVLGEVAWITSLSFIFLLFPDGQLPSPRWRTLAWIIGIIIVLSTVFQLLRPVPLPGAPVMQNPMGVAALEPLVAVYDSLGIILMVCLGGCLLSVFFRYRHAGPGVRRQIKPMALFGAAVAVSYFLIEFVRSNWGDSIVMVVLDNIATLMLSSFPLVIGFSILRSNLWDIDIVVNRALVYGGLTAAIVGLYAIVVGGLGAILQAQGNAAIAVTSAALVAVLFQPLHERVQRAANRLMYGQRDEPYTVLARFGRQLETTPALETLLPTIVAAIQTTLKLRHVEISVTGGRPEVDSEQLTVSSEKKAQGGLESLTIAFPLVYRGAAVGNIAVAPREGESELSPGDRRLLEDLARQAGVAVHAASVTVALQGARERLVTAREEERRRLRRDLHDGLGPTLAAIAAQTEAARDLIATRPELSTALLSDVVAQAQTATGDIRRLAHNLRPPALDDLGLAGAIRTQATRISQSSGLDVTVQADSLPALPAAVEVAAYFVAQEALTNVVRHAGARRCTIKVAMGEGDLALEIEDDGCGLGSPAEPGVGLRSMRERTAELGGEVLLTTPAGGGTTVRARLPVARDPTHETPDIPTSAEPLMAPPIESRQ